jgi:hypothetical protein
MHLYIFELHPFETTIVIHTTTRQSFFFPSRYDELKE